MSETTIDVKGLWDFLSGLPEERPVYVMLNDKRYRIPTVVDQLPDDQGAPFVALVLEAEGEPLWRHFAAWQDERGRFHPVEGSNASSE